MTDPSETSNPPDSSVESIAVGPLTHVELHSLAIRMEKEDFIVGRVETGEFVSLPRVGVRVVELIRKGYALDKVRTTLLAESGEDLEVESFVRTFIELGFVSKIDSRPIESDIPVVKAQGLWVKPLYVSWLFSRWAYGAYTVLFGTAILTLYTHPSLVPKYQDFFWLPLIGILIGVNAALFVGFALFHECAHFAAARSMNLPARLDISTRLDSLTLVTKVPALWSVPKTSRLRVYLAGIGSQFVVASILIIVIAYIPVSGLAYVLCKYMILEAFLMVLPQLELYLRTDLYPPFMDWLDCRNLFEDSANVIRHRVGVLKRTLGLGRSGSQIPNPLDSIRESERSKVYWYSWFVTVASVVVLTTALLFGVPITIQLYVQSIHLFQLGWQSGEVLLWSNGLIGLAIPTAMELTFLYAFIKTHPGGICRVKRVFVRSKLGAPGDA